MFVLIWFSFLRGFIEEWSTRFLSTNPHQSCFFDINLKRSLLTPEIRKNVLKWFFRFIHTFLSKELNLKFRLKINDWKLCIFTVNINPFGITFRRNIETVKVSNMFLMEIISFSIEIKILSIFQFEALKFSKIGDLNYVSGIFTYFNL